MKLAVTAVAAGLSLCSVAAPNAYETATQEYLVFGQPRLSGQQEMVKHAGLQVIHADGSVTLRLKEVNRREIKEKDGIHLVTTLKDEFYPVTVIRHVRTWNDCEAVETWTEISHSEKGPIKLLRADSFASPVKTEGKSVRISSLAGVWAWDANLRETSLAPGQILELASKSGTRDAWEPNAGMMIGIGEGVDENQGEVLGLVLEWTGTTCRRIRRDWDGKFADVFAGVDMTSGPYTLDAGKSFVTPRAVIVRTDKGYGEVSRQMHKWGRNHCLPHGRELHPVLLNSWEGSYFSFTEKTLTDMMDGVKEMGGEMFVLDDGWFGKGKYARDDKNRDTVGLGDWVVNPEKLPNGLGWLANEANRRGLKFGLWVEPEMVNTKSWLAEAHPEWILREANRPLLLGRGGTQVVLDCANPAVRNALYDMLDKVYSDIPTLAYVKWDCNQNIVNPGSTYLGADRQPNLWYDYTIGLYELLARLQEKRPNVMVQACASGGGHMDYGFLRYADEFWTSDDTDPLRRVYIQWCASLFYPACAMACHVTASPNHQTGRETPLKYRFDVAMCGRLGFELHPKNMSPDELAFAKAAVADYKRIRSVVQQGDLYRLASPYANPYSALMYVNPEKTHAVAFALALDKDGEHSVTLRFKGLDPERKYTVNEINRGEKLHGEFDGLTMTGAELAEKGIAVTLKGAYDSAVIEAR